MSWAGLDDGDNSLAFPSEDFSVENALSSTLPTPYFPVKDLPGICRARRRDAPGALRAASNKIRVPGVRFPAFTNATLPLAEPLAQPNAAAA